MSILLHADHRGSVVGWRHLGNRLKPGASVNTDSVFICLKHLETYHLARARNFIRSLKQTLAYASPLVYLVDKEPAELQCLAGIP